MERVIYNSNLCFDYRHISKEQGDKMKLKDFDFRIWHKESESFVDMVVSGTDLRIIPTDDDDMELELWSGFYDSKGVKIYDGDIVQDSQGNTLVVSDSVIAIIKKIDVEVIGNIHENAELLKGAE